MKKKVAPAAAPVARPEGQKKSFNFILIGIALLTAFLYSNCLHNDILNFDDNEYFAMYPEVVNLSWLSLKKIFTSYYLIMYQPLPVLSFAINYFFTGLDTFPLHVVNLSMHIANIFLVYRFIKLMSDKTTTATIVAVLFAIHPMSVEAVSWISARSSSMYTFFYLLALISYVQYHKNNFSVKYLGLTALFFILSLFTKAQAVTLPVLLLAIDYYYARKISMKMAMEKIPFFALSIIFGIITLNDPATQHNITNGMMVSYNTIDMLFMVCYSFMFYFYKLILPINLCAVYVYPPKINGMLPWEYYASPVFLLLVAFALYRFRKNRVVIFGAALFFITISINIQIIPSRLFIVTERYTYFPYIGLFFITGYYYNAIKEGIIKAGNNALNIFSGVLIVLGLFFAYTITERNQVWENDLVFMTDILEKNPRVPYISRAYGNRANYYLNNNMPNEAIADFKEALAVKHDDAQTYYNIGLSYTKLNDFKSALTYMDSALKLKPDGALILSNLAFIKFTLQDPEGALAASNACIKLDSTTIPEVYNTRAAIYFNRHDLVQAERDLDKALAIRPEFTDALTNRGLLYLNTNRRAQACEDWNKATYLGNSKAQGLMSTNCK
jgi:Flp pilus assembly protein TadD